MKSDIKNIGGEIVTCPSCDNELELDDSESISRKFVCPNCNVSFELDKSPIQEITHSIIKRGKMEFTFGEKFEFWLAPIIFLSLYAVILSRGYYDSIVMEPLKLFVLLMGLFHLYRAVVSSKLTYIPNSESIQKKIQMVQQLQKKYRWIVSEAKNGSFVFIDNYFMNRQEILIVCTQEGFYLHCMVRAQKLGSGVAVYQTWRVGKYLKSYPFNSDKK